MTKAAKEDLGFHPLVWLQSLHKRIVESQAGRGGLEALCAYLDQIADFIPELVTLNRTIKANSLFYEAALGKCSREMLKRPLPIREEECFSMLGGTCPKCGYETSISSLFSRHTSRCPKCGERLKPTYFVVLEKMMDLGLEATPEAILMYVAHEKLADAYVAAYKAFKLVMDETAKRWGWDHYRIDSQEIRNYLDSYFLGRLVGETKIPREEKQLLQFLARGNMAGIPVEEAERLIRLGTEVIKYGYLYQVLMVTEAHAHYLRAVSEYSRLYAAMNEKIRTRLIEIYAVKEERRVTLSEVRGGEYAPCVYMPRSAWETGTLSEDIDIRPLYTLPIFPKANMGSLQAVYGKLGSGKTFLLSSLACYAIMHGEVVFSPLNDKSNSFTYAALPLFPYDSRTKQLYEMLRGFEIEPAGVPVLTLNFLRRGETIVDDWKHPPTIFDRIIEIDNPLDFKIDFQILMDELKGISEQMGYGDLRGIICVRNLGRFNNKTREDIDVEVATNLIRQFDSWRKGHLSIDMRVMIDEISHLAPSTIFSGDSLMAGRTVLDLIKESRRNRISVDIATQVPLEVLPNIRDEATNVFFRKLATSRDKSRSQIDVLLGSLQLYDPSIAEVVKSINNRGVLGNEPWWFWYHEPRHSIELIRPLPPTFCLQDPNRTARQIFRLYEKRFNDKVLLESWRKVEKIEPESKGTRSRMKDWGILR